MQEKFKRSRRQLDIRDLRLKVLRSMPPINGDCLEFTFTSRSTGWNKWQS